MRPRDTGSWDEQGIYPADTQSNLCFLGCIANQNARFTSSSVVYFCNILPKAGSDWGRKLGGPRFKCLGAVPVRALQNLGLKLGPLNELRPTA
jgi:hypothetical protein